MQPSNLDYVISDADPKYRCCCNHIHVRIGAIVIGIFELFGCLFVMAMHAFGKHENSLGGLSIVMVNSILNIIAVILMFMGIYKRKSILILPHLVLQVIDTICFLIWSGFSTAEMVQDRASRNSTTYPELDPQYYDLETIQRIRRISEEENTRSMWTVISLGVVFILVAVVLQIWFFVVILKLYLYYREMAKVSADHNQPMDLILSFAKKDQNAINQTWVEKHNVGNGEGEVKGNGEGETDSTNCTT